MKLATEYDPKGALENAGDALGIFSKRLQTTVEPFKDGRPYGRIVAAVLADGKILGPATSPPSNAGATPQP